MADLHVHRYADAYRALCNPHLAQALYQAGGVIMDDVLLTLHGESHKDRRHLALRIFKRDFAKHYERNVFPATLAATLRQLQDVRPFDLVEFGYRVTMNLTADFAGIDRPLETAEETRTLLRLVRKFSEGATLVHSTRDRETVRAEVRDALDEFDVVFLAPSRARREALLSEFAAGRLAEAMLPRDMLTVLLRNEDRLALPDDVLRREVAFYLQAGSHSTANAMVHAVHEIFAWCDTRPDERHLIRDDARYLQRCVHESLRLHPASPIALRTALKAIDFPWGDHVDEGDSIVIDLAAANRDVSVFGDEAEAFNPRRVLSDSRAQPFGLTFGVGIHSCLGRDLDGGLVPGGGSELDDRQFGIVTLLVKALLDRGVMPDPAAAPTEDVTTARRNWGFYPVRFEGEVI